MESQYNDETLGQHLVQHGTYYRAHILPKVFKFLHRSANVMDKSEMVILHDKAPGWRANATQDMLSNSTFDFFKASEWPSNSPNLNPTENPGSILKDRVDTLIAQETREDQLDFEILITHVHTVLRELEQDSELFKKWLLSMQARLDAVKTANGGHTKY